MKPFSRTFLAVLLCALGVGSARAESGVEGTWDSPFGRVKIEKTGEQVVGRVAEASRVCGFGKGTEVLRGRFDDDVFSGEVRVCYAQGCHDEEWAFALAAALGGDRLVGSLGTPAHGCQNAVVRARSFTFVRARPAAVVEPVAPLPVATKKPTRIVMKPAARPFFEEGFEYSTSGQFERAQKKLRQAEEIDPSNPEILTQLGITYSARRDWSSARVYYQRATRSDPTYLTAHFNLACAFAQENKLREGMRSLKAAVDLGFADLGAFDGDQELDPLRSQPGFDELRRAVEKNRRGAR